jgi:hypothetical protein
MIKRLFIDIETSPCIGDFWRPGYNVTLTHKNIRVQARIITLAYKWQHEKKINTLVWSPLKKGRPFSQCDEKLVRKTVDVMNEADEIIAHYGDGFDVPWIRTRSLYHGIITGIWKTVDTKAWSSKYFILPSNKLDAIAQYLGIGEKIRTEYDLWESITWEDDQHALDKMSEYNVHDVELLEPVWDALQHYVPPPTHAGVHAGKEKWTCPECGAEPKRRQRPMVSATGMVKHQMYCGACRRYYMINNTAYNQWVEQR